MFYDLSVPWTSEDDPELLRTVAFLDELGYNVIALNYTLTGKIPNKVTCPIPKDPFPNHSNIRFLSRVTVILDDHGQNYGLPALANIFDVVAVRPTSERLLAQACQSLECDLISLDCSIRHPYHFKHKTLGLAIARGLRLEISYAAALASDSNARRNVLSNAMALVKATKGKGLVASSEAKKAAGCRAPFDIINLATLWGLSQDKGRQTVADNPRSVVVQAAIRRRSFRGVIDVVDPGGVIAQHPPPHTKSKQGGAGSKVEKQKEKGSEAASKEDTPMSAVETDTPMSDMQTPITPAGTTAKPGGARTKDQASHPNAAKGKRKQAEAGVMEEDTPEKRSDENADETTEKKENPNTRAKRPSKKQRVKDGKKAAAASAS